MCNISNISTIQSDIDIFFDSLGLIGGIIFTVCNIPQLIKIVKTKSSKDISLASLFLYFIGSTLILIYGIYFELFAIYVPCVIEVLFEVVLIIMKLYYDKCYSRDIERNGCDCDSNSDSNSDVDKV
tara:strand:- start:22 stop:399 length:378 start_codon:yes stop_codon:yes gene_type:complete